MNERQIVARLVKFDKSKFRYLRCSNRASLILDIEKQMLLEAENENYERAAVLRDRIRKLWGPAAP